MQEIKIGDMVLIDTNSVGTVLEVLPQNRGYIVALQNKKDNNLLFVLPDKVEKISKPRDLAYNTERYVEVTKEMTFDSCHNLLNYKGACSRLHGHTYKLHVTVKGIVDSRGIVIDFKELKSLVSTHVVEFLDHQYLNANMQFNTTAENMVMFFYDLLKLHIKNLDDNVYLVEVKLWETPTSFATYRG